MSNKGNRDITIPTHRAAAEIAVAVLEDLSQRPEIAAAMRADATLKGRMLAAGRDAAANAAANATRRAGEIVRLCGEHGRPLQEATRLIVSGKSLEQCEVELKRAANAASWNKAVGEGQQQGAQGAPAAGWHAAVARANGQS